MKAVDLFCGCGGLSLGFERAGIEILAGFDNWHDDINVYRQNFSHPVINCDLRKVDEASNKIKEYSPDIIIGEPLCATCDSVVCEVIMRIY